MRYHSQLSQTSNLRWQCFRSLRLRLNTPPADSKAGRTVELYSGNLQVDKRPAMYLYLILDLLGSWNSLNSLSYQQESPACDCLGLRKRYHSEKLHMSQGLNFIPSNFPANSEREWSTEHYEMEVKEEIGFICVVIQDQGNKFDTRRVIWRGCYSTRRIYGKETQLLSRRALIGVLEQKNRVGSWEENAQWQHGTGWQYVATRPFSICMGYSPTQIAEWIHPQRGNWQGMRRDLGNKCSSSVSLFLEHKR